MKKLFFALLVLVNCMVLLGQLWPAGAPPFAHTVNIIFLVTTLVFFSVQLFRKK